MDFSQVETQRLDHLGIVAGVCREIKLIQQIDRKVGATDRKVSVGEAVQAMVLNALGFTSRALYLTPAYFANKPVALLIREGLTAEDFNDDSLGRALDRLYETGITEVFTSVASHALDIMGISQRFYHLDTTTFSLQGAYEIPSEDPKAVMITHGYSKDHRPDLKQIVVSLICSYQSTIPLWLEALSGNNSDKTSFPKTIKAYVEQLQGKEKPYFIADSALYCATNLRLMELSNVFWISRVPETVADVVKCYARWEEDKMQASNQPGYYFQEISSEYGGVSQRWLVVFSELAYLKEEANFRKQLQKERERVEKTLWHLTNQEFATASEAQEAIQKTKKTKRGGYGYGYGRYRYRYHRLEMHLLEVPKHKHQGRPRKGAIPASLVYKLKGRVIEDEEAIARSLQRKGKFILATNQLDTLALPSETILAAYKQQGVSVERGFRFLKDPLFFASSLFLEKPERIMALTMVMGLALLVYALAEHKLRSQLMNTGMTLPNQLGKPTQRPTMRWIFQLFEGIDVLLVPKEMNMQRYILNLKPIHHQILNLLGPEVQKCYFGKT